MIEIANLTFNYSEHSNPALVRVNFVANSSELVLLSGQTGSGKSTLLKAIIGLAPHFTGGVIGGKIKIDGSDVLGKKPHELAHLIGYVNQQPESAFATDTVEEELAFGMEQLGFEPSEMRSRVLRTAELVGVTHLLTAPLENLSGGEQQRVAIGAAIAAGQKVLLLDEPTSALDGVSSLAILELLRRLTRDEGFTVLLSEHRIERVRPFADRVLELEPDFQSELPVTQVEKGYEPAAIGIAPPRKVILGARNLTKSYDGREVLQPMDLDLAGGDVVAVVGDNGSGKSSLLWELLEAAWRDSVEVAMVPQTAADLLFLNTVSAELAEADNLGGGPRASQYLERLIGRIDTNLHPRDLSAGQQLGLVLAIQLAKGAGLVILDEPTRGLDNRAKANLALQIKELAESGRSVIFATHDHTFANSIATRTLELENGRLTNA